MMKVATLVLEKTCLPADELQAVFFYTVEMRRRAVF